MARNWRLALALALTDDEEDTCFNGYNKNAFKSFKIYMLCFVDPLLHRSDTGYNHKILQLFCRTLGHIKINLCICRGLETMGIFHSFAFTLGGALRLW